MTFYWCCITLFRFVCAQVLFKPLLTTLGLHIDAVKRSALMKKFGGNVSIKGALNALRIDIVESEEVVWMPRMTGKGSRETGFAFLGRALYG